jgi:hypothetical protein
MSSSARLPLLIAWPALAGLLLSPSCKGDAFSPDGSQGGDDSMGGAAEAGSGKGSSAEAGAGGAAQEGGAMPVGGEGGSGACSSSEDCASGQFCSEGACLACSDLSSPSTLAYGVAEPFELINATTEAEGLRFARRAQAGTGLVYVRDFFGGTLWVTPDPLSSAGSAISKTDVFETGGLPLALELPAPLDSFNFFFSRRARTGADTARSRLFGAVQAADGTLSGEQELPAPFNSEEVVASYGLALSSTRAVWSRNTDGVLAVKLVTSPVPAQGEPTELRLPLPGGCQFAAELDYSPWLTPDGSTLFFTARRVDEGCEPSLDAATHIYVLALSPAGQPVGTAHALTGSMDPSVRQTDASLSADGCELLFSAQPETGMRLYRARRIR